MTLGRMLNVSVPQCFSSVKWATNIYLMVFPHGSVVKNLSANAGDTGSIPGSGRLPGEGNGNPLQYSCLANPMDMGAWQTTVHGVTKESDMT